ncbi:MAG: carbohydrate kinase [Atribacterota bacterium]|uniref:carbohydrate kinase family protein n=1 Tax=Atribacter sp. TaxID=2847780 RepID=UPI001763089F|nr:carbohydrate kinase [Atribacterota bacterium]MDI9594394.1 carbohydrate kinase [Atribacterota bacterium]HHT11058.1 carbohydrate kinase [Candidatus Atribacteria bacterium]
MRLLDKKAICLGELLIDFVSTLNGVTLRDAPGFEKAPGGAPANVAVGLSKLGIETYFIGKIGKDAFGDFLRMTLDKYGVKTNYLTTTTKAKTTLAFVSLTEEGERDFVFYRDPGADMLLDQSDIIDLIFSGSGVFHFGSITMTHEPSNSATFKAIQLARKYGYLVSFDPNLRPALWKTLDEAREKMRLGMELSDVVKLNEEEAMFIAETNTVEEAIRYLQRSYNLALVIITLGKEGSILVHQEKSLRVEGFPVHAVDTTGAGDGFVAGLISSLYMFWNDLRERKSIPDDTLRYAGRRANAVGALTTLKKGAIPALPTQEEVEIFIEENPL